MFQRLWNWLFPKKTRSPVEEVIQLMQFRPLEWDFSARVSTGGYYNPQWDQIVHHRLSGLGLKLRYNNEHDTAPAEVKFDSDGQVKLVGQERSLLISAVETLRHSRFNAVAAQYLKLEIKINCGVCKKKINGWSWVCKCQCILDQDCHSNANVCPDCGGTLVSES